MPAAAPLCRQQRQPRRGAAPQHRSARRAAQRLRLPGEPKRGERGEPPRELHPGDGQRKIPNATRGAAPPSPGGSTAAPSSAEVAAPSASTRDTRRAEPRSKAHSSNAQRSAPRLSVRLSVRPLRFHRGNRSARAPNPAEPPTNAASDKHKEPFMAQRGAEPQPGSDGESTPLRAPSAKAELRPRRGGGRREPRAVRDGGPGRTGCGGRGAQPGGHSDGSGTERRSAGTAWA